ncbi:uncharacterized protein LOC143519565 isoform X1 [Brachyhypopomus gauderio]|uniref:uncharacterized protein LOC143519565 isoform X1 n=1 Tax=Brachyhypopomus gauderio TaxID=698409 RepID=UPI004041A06E
MTSILLNVLHYEESTEESTMSNFRGPPQIRKHGEHVSLSEFKEYWSVNNHYLSKTNIPSYPESVLFRISRVCHVTGESGVRGIIGDGGFRRLDDNFLWFSLYVSENEISSAERRFLRWSLEDGYRAQRPLLEKFTTSPAFQRESRYGNFCFNFPIRKVLHLYSRQFCGQSAPVLRVLGTELYRQEILYSVLVHPPHVHQYNDYPRLPSGMGGVCGYREGCMSWTCQSPSDCYNYSLKVDDRKCKMSAKRLGNVEYYYVWDHVAMAFHMEPGWTFSIDREELLENVSVCDMTKPNLLRPPDTCLTRNAAETILENLREMYGQDYQRYY